MSFFFFCRCKKRPKWATIYDRRWLGERLASALIWVKQVFFFSDRQFFGIFFGSDFFRPVCYPSSPWDPSPTGQAHFQPESHGVGQPAAFFSSQPKPSNIWRNFSEEHSACDPRCVFLQQQRPSEGSGEGGQPHEVSAFLGRVDTTSHSGREAAGPLLWFAPAKVCGGRQIQDPGRFCLVGGPAGPPPPRGYAGGGGYPEGTPCGYLTAGGVLDIFSFLFRRQAPKFFWNSNTDPPKSGSVSPHRGVDTPGWETSRSKGVRRETNPEREGAFPLCVCVCVWCAY